MNIVIFSMLTSAPWGGSENLWFKTASVAIDQRHKVLIVLHKIISNHDNISLLRNKGAKIFVIQDHLISFRERLANKINPFYSKNKFLKSITKQLTLFKADTILINQAGCFDIVFHNDIKIFLQRTNVPFSICSHSYLQEDILSHSDKKIFRSIFEKAHVCYFVASIQQKTILKQIGAVPNKIDYVYNPLNDSVEYVPYPKKQGVLKLAMVGSLDIKWKGQEVLIEILSEKYWLEQPWELNIYGIGPDFDYLKQLIKFKGLDDRIFLKGYEANQKEIWKHNHILLMPSKVDAAPSSMLEAMACGRTCVCSNIGFVSEWITSNKIGFMAKSTSKETFLDALKIAWDNKSNWEQLGINCKDLISEKIIEAPELKFLNKLLSQ